MMLSSMFSPVKKEDKELLLAIAEMIETLVKNGTKEALDLAEKFGQDYLNLEKKIQTYDYTETDQTHDLIEKLVNNK